VIGTGDVAIQGAPRGIVESGDDRRDAIVVLAGMIHASSSHPIGRNWYLL
jgi:hypothetical protein